MVEKRHLNALRTIIDALQDSSVAWAVTGSLGMVLQGMDLQVHDIDIQTDEDGAYEIERRLAQFMVQPIIYKASARMRSRMGKFAIEGIQVEVIGAIQKRLQDGSWEPPVQVPSYRHWVDVGALRVPVLSLEYEYQAYILMGRDERAALIKAWLDKHGTS